jgi:hypothetical protein
MDWVSVSRLRISREVEFPYAFWSMISAIGALLLGIVLNRRLTGVLIAVCLGGISLWHIRDQSSPSDGFQTTDDSSELFFFQFGWQSSQSH